jgi:hypothetical protein
MAPSTTVQDLCASVKALDPSVSHVEIRDKEGFKASKSLPVGQLLTLAGWSMHVNDMSLQSVVQSTGESGSSAMTGGQHSAAFDALLASLRRIDRPAIKHGEYLALVQSSLEDAGVVMDGGAIEETAAAWRQVLSARGELLMFPQAVESEIRDTVFLRPAALQQQLVKALDIDGEKLPGELGRKREELVAVEAKLGELKETEQDVHTRAERFVKIAAVGVGGFMVAQYSYLFYLVMNISWDFCEPLCYFIGGGWGIAFLLFFMTTRRDPYAGNVFQVFSKWRANKLLAGMNDGAYPTLSALAGEQGRLHKRIAKLTDDVQILSRRLRKDA